MATTYIYSRVSTDEQSHDQQVGACADYCEERLGLDSIDINVIRDTATGTNTNRDGYQQLISKAEDGEVDRVVVKEVSRIARNMRDLNRAVGQLVDDNGVALHILDSGLKIGEDEDQGLFDDRLVLQMLGIAAEIEAKLTKQRTQAALNAARSQGKWTGRPPYGFDVVDGYLVPNENYDQAVAIISSIEEGASVRSTAKAADVSRSTVRNIVDRKSLYLDEYDSDFEIKEPDEVKRSEAGDANDD